MLQNAGGEAHRRPEDRLPAMISLTLFFKALFLLFCVDEVQNPAKNKAG
jgi:hypothetical protein